MNTVALDTVEMDGGKLKDVEAVLKPLRDEHAGLFGKTEYVGTPPTNPPAGDTKMTKEAFEKLPLLKRMEYINAHPEEKTNLI